MGYQSYKPSWKIGLENSLRSRKNKKAQILRRALRGSARPWSIEQVKAYEPMKLQTFYENIGHIFPLILELRSQGLSSSKVELTLGFKHRFLRRIFERYPKMLEVFNQAKRARLDSIAQ